MSTATTQDRRRNGQDGHEPLLPIEKKLITWSLAVGIVLLVVLAFIRRMFI